MDNYNLKLKTEQKTLNQPTPNFSHMNSRNWGFSESSNGAFKSHLGLQLMSSMDEKPLFGGGGGFSDHDHHHHHHIHPMLASTNGGPFHHHRVESHFPVDYWVNQNRDKYVNFFSGSQHHGYHQPHCALSSETSSAHSAQMPPNLHLAKHETVIEGSEEVCMERDTGSEAVLPKKRGGKLPKSPPKEKKPRTRAPRAPKEESAPSVHRGRAPKKSVEVVINGVSMDISGIAIPVCSCTGTPQQCYRWGFGGWQSACCTTGLSMYPLPMSTKRRGARIAGRKMSIGAFKKVLEKLASEGYNFSNPIDLRNYWAKHGTNKFVTIR